jgi:5-methylcytosine-specific restriction endonuclease McrA
VEVFRHTVPGKRFSPKPSETHLGWRWSRMRARILMRSPLCHDCGALAQCVHHIVPRSVAPARVYDETNCMSLCNECHDARHKSS